MLRSTDPAKPAQFVSLVQNDRCSLWAYAGASTVIEALKPGYWTPVASHLKAGDRIFMNGGQFADLVVVSVKGSEVKCGVIGRWPASWKTFEKHNQYRKREKSEERASLRLLNEQLRTERKRLKKAMQNGEISCPAESSPTLT